MIRCNLWKLMGERRMKIADVARETGIHRNMIALLYYEKAKQIKFDVLEKLCRFFRCNVGDLLELNKGPEITMPKEKE